MKGRHTTTLPAIRAIHIAHVLLLGQSFLLSEQKYAHSASSSSLKKHVRAIKCIMAIFSPFFLHLLALKPLNSWKSPFIMDVEFAREFVGHVADWGNAILNDLPECVS